MPERATTQELLGDAPLEKKYGPMMRSIAKAIDRLFNEDLQKPVTGFVLMVFPFGLTDGRCNYVSNARREDIIVLLREQLSRFEGMPEQEGHG